MRALLLGCGGFIGSHLVERLLGTTDHEIEGWDLETSKIDHLLGHRRFRFERRSISEPENRQALRDAIARADVVVALAAICNPSAYNTRPIDVIRSSFLDVVPTIEECVDHKKWLVFFSTSEVYGRTLSSYVDPDYNDPALYELDEAETPLIFGPTKNQRWSYACAKQLGERFIYGYGMEAGLPFTIIRPLNFFGPRMDFIPGREGDGVPRVLANFMGALLDGKPLPLVDGGHARRMITSIHDAIDALMLMLAQPAQAQGRIFNIGNPANEVTMRDLALRMRQTFAAVTGRDLADVAPAQEISALDFYGEGYEDCDRRLASIEQARSQLGWEPTRSIDDILREVVQYYVAKFADEQAAPVKQRAAA